MDYIHPVEKFNINVPSKKLRKLQNDIWRESPIKATLYVEEDSYPTKMLYRGHHIRKFRKKSYDLYFKEPYFQDQKLIHLNAEYKDPSLIRNKLSFDFFHEIGVIAPRSKHVQLSINSELEGVYLQIESFDERFLQRRSLPEGDIYYATNDDANFSLITPEGKEKKSLLDGYRKKYSFRPNDEQLEKLIFVVNTAPNETFAEQITQLLNMEKYLRWLCGVVCTHNFDGFIHNYALYENGETNLFEISPWDYDGTWGRNLNGDVIEHDYIPITGYNSLTARILSIPEFRRMYHDLLAEILENTFTTSNLENYIHDLLVNIRPYVKDDPYYGSIERFDDEYEFILDFIHKRNTYLKGNLKQLH
jgi:spore coat protein H